MTILRVDSDDRDCAVCEAKWKFTLVDLNHQPVIAVHKVLTCVVDSLRDVHNACIQDVTSLNACTVMGDDTTMLRQRTADQVGKQHFENLPWKVFQPGDGVGFLGRCLWNCVVLDFSSHGSSLRRHGVWKL
jgi:hypothetical protein